MKKLYFAFIIILSITLLSWSGGYTIPASGAPGDARACGNAGCHSAGAFDPSMELSLTDLDGNIIERYLPGAEYLVNVTINTSSTVPPSGYGFQMVCLDDQQNPVNNFTDLPDGVREFGNADRQYVVQSMRLPTNTVAIPWTAPDAGSVTFYSGGNAVNGNGGASGDGATSTSATFEQGSTSTVDINNSTLRTYPNPVTKVLNIEGATSDVFRLLDLRGHLLIEQSANQMDVSALDAGVYLLMATTAQGETRVKRVIKN